MTVDNARIKRSLSNRWTKPRIRFYTNGCVSMVKDGRLWFGLQSTLIKQALTATNSPN